MLINLACIGVRGKLICGRGVVIDVNCIFEGDVMLADGVCIGAHTVIYDTAVEADAEILPLCHIGRAKAGADSRISPYARLCPNTKLAEDVYIGSFVEVKNSQIAAHSKANHLTYVGNATVGSHVNIGTGTIACNCDGANKSRTVIEDDAFTGPGTQLVAPVRAGKGATLSAGTALTKDAPEGELTVSRAWQVIIGSWQCPIKQKREG